MTRGARVSLYLKGVCMGLADLIPGVSGGTIALISGIYDRLIFFLARLDLQFLSLLFRFKFAKIWQEYDMFFALLLGFGILCGIAGGAGTMHSLLENYPPLVYAFFFGVVLASTLKLLRLKHLLSPFFFGGVACILLVTFGLQLSLPWSPLYIFGGGILSVSAMLLPGISGSLVLLLLGLYRPLLDALVTLQLGDLLLFYCGGMVALFGFSKLIHIALKKYAIQTMSFLLGLMLGALPKLWPWQVTEPEFTLLSPADYAGHGTNALIAQSMLAFLVGVAAINYLMFLSVATKKTSDKAPNKSPDKPPAKPPTKPPAKTTPPE